MDIFSQEVDNPLGSSLSEKTQGVVGDDVGKALEGELRHKDRMLAGFFHGLDDYVVHPRYIDFILRNNLAQDLTFQQSLEKKLTTILQSPAILSDRGWDLQNFLIILSTYEEVFREVRLPATTIEVLKNRVEFLRLNSQSGAIIDRLAQFLPKH